MLLYKFNRHLRRKSCHAKRATAFVVWAILLADDHNLNGSGLVPVDEMDAIELAKIHLAVHSGDGHIAADDGET